MRSSIRSSAIVKGNITAAADWVENALAKVIPVAIGFLASLLGLGDPSKPVKETIEKAQAPVNKAIDWVIHGAVKLVKFGKKNLGKDQSRRQEAHWQGQGALRQAGVLPRRKVR